MTGGTILHQDGSPWCQPRDCCPLPVNSSSPHLKWMLGYPAQMTFDRLLSSGRPELTLRSQRLVKVTTAHRASLRCHPLLSPLFSHGRIWQQRNIHNPHCLKTATLFITATRELPHTHRLTCARNLHLHLSDCIFGSLP